MSEIVKSPVLWNSGRRFRDDEGSALQFCGDDLKDFFDVPLLGSISQIQFTAYRNPGKNRICIQLVDGKYWSCFDRLGFMRFPLTRLCDFAVTKLLFGGVWYVKLHYWTEPPDA